jgi:probable phosphoglycerate mutase
VLIDVECSYEHHSIDEPAILLGGAFVVDVVEKEREETKGQVV